MSGIVPWLLLAVAAGAVLPVQAAVNARLGAALGGPLWGAFVSFLVGTVGLGLVLALRRSWPVVGSVPAWAWFGGLLGAFYVGGVTAAVSRLGGAVLVGLIVAGQIAAALAVDASGLLPVQRAVGWQGIAGALLIVAGVVVVARR
ncbi:MAG: DMT family transporter [Sphingomonadaceae bacterium]|nr:DMT family transporter [Sphingomonadaceae bacterium]